MQVSKETNFQSDQLNEISQGKADGLDVSVYALPAFDALQMREIRLGMMNELNISLYAKPEFDWFQMQEIRLGLEEGLSVNYAYQNIPYEKMRQFRLALEKGLNLMNYRNLEAGIIKEVRLAAEDNVNIGEFISQGYEAEQLMPIRYALKKNLNIKPYLNPEYRGVAINELVLGLEKGLDISKYANVEYSWQQMREIRLGLEKRLDVDEYLNPLYEWRQMSEIRLGLEEDLDVSYYKSLMYTSRDMRKRREKLMSMEPVFSMGEDAIADVRCDSPEVMDLVSKILGDKKDEALGIPAKKEECTVTISEDGMKAFIEYNGDQDKISKDYIYSLLKGFGVIFGVIEKTVELLMNGNGIGEPLLIARGKEPGEGRDGWYEYFFNTDIDSGPKLLPDGTVDYKSYSWFTYVEKDQKLAEYHPAECGRYGYSVTGKMLKGGKGQELIAISGSGFRISDDMLTYFAADRGKLTYKPGIIDISSVLEVDEVTQSTGNIDFDGDVHVKGGVGNGAFVKASGDIIVDGFVENAVIYSGGDVLLRSGMNSVGAGVVTAEGKITGQFFERVVMKAKGDINADYCMNCDIETDQLLHLFGNKGSLIGGHVRATLGMNVKTVGNWTNVPSTIVIGLHDGIVKQVNEIDSQKNSVDNEIRILANAYEDFKKKYPPEIRNSMPMFIKIENAIYTKKLELDEIAAAKSKVNELIEETKNVAVMISDKLYENIEFEINRVKWQSRLLSNCRLRNSDGTIVVSGSR